MQVGQQLVNNLAVRQCLLELLDTFVGDLGVLKPQLFETRQPFQMHQPGIGDSRATQAQRLEPRQPLQMYQPSVGDLRAVQPQRLEVRQRLQLFLRSG